MNLQGQLQFAFYSAGRYKWPAPLGGFMSRLVLSVLLLSALGTAQVKAPSPKPKELKMTPPDASTSDAAPAASGTRLPVRRVVLYKNGVGYFEHTGAVRGSQEVNIDFTTGQLNDVVKSLTV